MDTVSTPQKTVMVPALFKSGTDFLAQLDHQLDGLSSNSELLELVVSQAKERGWRYLFEVPGSLFDHPSARAAAMVEFTDETRPAVVVLVCELSTGTIQIVEESGLEDEVIEFLDAYAGVLEMLDGVSAEKKLHA
ncbi:MAG: hypothetical protein AAFN43_05860 [Pseudomonadota bacterium]